MQGNGERATRRGRPGYDLGRLLEVTVRVFNERGYEGTSMEDLSHRLGITKSAIYHHVSGKDELLRLSVNRALDALFAVLEEEESATGPAIHRLEHVVRRSVEVLIAELPFVTLLLRVRGNTRVERQALARRREFDRFVTDLVKQAVAEGSVRPDVDPALTARLLFGMVNSISEWYRPNRGMRSAEIADAVTKVAFSGLRTPTEVLSSDPHSNHQQ
ncbi:TetR/AcrR family transcriptional regulator [Saccharopolyspora rectivirgula]|jgi:AcrR family transcriptional regulator|uniref:TetR family transcriptional regulator n=1 Tax=Saccharopolyspora rectivirgula TaxID=28042 RepID=A0A073AWP7_9PSEU|nr:TetR/AcrR family transcriptional regulator [Saccharopolyspora rectivirgula]KEI43830.1 TetR family transcriptional regulator [Saccharopolyspora rectivirgula]